MPQFDQFSFFIQVFWFIFIFFIFYFLFTYFFLPKICYNIKFRKKKLIFKNKKKNQVNFEKFNIKLFFNKFYKKFFFFFELLLLKKILIYNFNNNLKIYNNFFENKIKLILNKKFLFLKKIFI
jgi:hypothetical protein